MASGTFEIFNDSSSRIDGIDAHAVHEVISSIFNDFGKSTGWINVVFMDCDEHNMLNFKHLKHDYDTDILTFDFSERGITSGEIYINADVAKDNADLYKVSFQNELSRLIIHGALHLAGINDKTKDEREAMRKLEDKYLKCFM